MLPELELPVRTLDTSTKDKFYLTLYGKAAVAVLLVRSDRPAKLAPLCPLANGPG